MSEAVDSQPLLLLLLLLLVHWVPRFYCCCCCVSWQLQHQCLWCQLCQQDEVV
jgi:hypothetical protein